ncbi:MAG: hypothetical protein IPJ37_05440 [Bacteroidales bacterium]|nr:hypothetical protein [Bacteroidales bacterium]
MLQLHCPVAAYSSTNMISTGGAGYLQKNGNAAASFQIVFPVGSGGNYSPMTISSVGTITPTYIRIRAVPSAINPSYILKYWDVSANAAINNVTATFQYDASESNGASSSISYSPNSGTSWQNPPSSGNFILRNKLIHNYRYKPFQRLVDNGLQNILFLPDR